jgi:hypothetical protein
MDEFSPKLRLAVVLSAFTMGSLLLSWILLREWTLPSIALGFYLDASLLTIAGALYAFYVTEVAVRRTDARYPLGSGEAQVRLAQVHRQQQRTIAVFFIAALVALGLCAALAILNILFV